MRLCIFFILILSLCNSGCSLDQTGTAKAKMLSESDALEIAKKEFLQIYPDRLPYYKVSILNDRTKSRWHVTFVGQGKYKRPGYFTDIFVDKKSRKVTVMHGE